jgi:hypothetical protein
MTTVFISHKLINEFKDKIPTLISNQEESDRVIQCIKEMLKYDEDKKHGIYKK